MEYELIHSLTQTKSFSTQHQSVVPTKKFQPLFLILCFRVCNRCYGSEIFLQYSSVEAGNVLAFNQIKLTRLNFLHPSSPIFALHNWNGLLYPIAPPFTKLLLITSSYWETLAVCLVESVTVSLRYTFESKSTSIFIAFI